jgi:hypothetical protein
MTMQDHPTERLAPSPKRIILSRDAIGGKLWRSWCESPGCVEKSKERWDKTSDYLEGWWRAHVCETNHTVVIEETPPEEAQP